MHPVFPISIHAPARGATAFDIHGVCNRFNFNSRPCERGDKPFFGLNHFFKNFNSRPCERGDFFGMKDQQEVILDFNSRPCERGDAINLKSRTLQKISIHAPARGATAKTDKNASELYCNCDKNIMGFKENDNCCREMACFFCHKPLFFCAYLPGFYVTAE